MGKRTIPQEFEYTCDVAGCTAHQSFPEDRGQHPPGWAYLHLYQAAQDFQGAEVADASRFMILCPKHRHEANAFVDRLRTGKK